MTPVSGHRRASQCFYEEIQKPLAAGSTLEYCQLYGTFEGADSALIKFELPKQGPAFVTEIIAKLTVGDTLAT